MEAFGEVSSTYTEQAIEDGRLIPIGEDGFVPVYASKNCFFKAGLDNPLRRRGVVTRALAVLRRRDPRDAFGGTLRVMHKDIAADYDCLWVIFDGEAVTIMFPEDY